MSIAGPPTGCQGCAAASLAISFKVRTTLRIAGSTPCATGLVLAITCAYGPRARRIFGLELARSCPSLEPKTTKRVATAAKTSDCVAFFRAVSFFLSKTRCPGFVPLAELSAPGVRRDALRAMLRAYAGSRDGVPVAFAAKTLGFFGDDGAAAFEAYAASLHAAEPSLFARPLAFGIASDGATRVLDARASLGLEPLPPTRGPSPAIACAAPAKRERGRDEARGREKKREKKRRK